MASSSNDRRGPAGAPAALDSAPTEILPGRPDALERTEPAPATPPPRERAARDSGGPSGSSTSPAEGLGSAADALHQDEIRRSRLLARFGLLLAAAVTGALFVLPGDPVMTWVAAAAIAVASAGNAYLYWMSLSPERYRPVPVTAVWVSAAVAVSCGILYFGAFSAAAMVVSLGIYFLALGRSFALALVVYALCAAIQLGAATAIIAGAWDDPGLVRVGDLPPGVLIVLEGLIQLILGAAFVMARASRRVTLQAVNEHERAIRALAQRDALLHEARQDLERALQVGGMGRYSGQVIGSFRLAGILGRGSMGEVYEATHAGTGEPAAVKLLQEQSLGNPSYVMRFLREVQLASALEVPHVVRVLEIGDATAPVPYLAMERLRGRDLAQILRAERRLSPAQVLDLVHQASRGIAAAAAAGIVHRDLKPQNLFLADQPGGPPVWKILDFGVSKLVGGRGTLTGGQVVGTPIYMAPEQAQGADVDHRADLYALAAIAYRCLTGHLPFRARDVPTILYRVVYQMPVRPGALVEVSPDVDDCLLIAMAKDPAQRFGEPAELAAALEDALRGRLAGPLRERARALAAAHPWRPRP
ncbi:MAG TPA: serine/threonine-protein kinase [Kofleriaceae bacterium]|nr:serine/threonine-protein kinase [Kofleriaceae bacterium]